MLHPTRKIPSPLWLIVYFQHPICFYGFPVPKKLYKRLEEEEEEEVVSSVRSARKENLKVNNYYCKIRPPSYQVGKKSSTPLA